MALRRSFVTAAFRAGGVIAVVRLALLGLGIAIAHGHPSGGRLAWGYLIAVLPSIWELELANDWSQGSLLLAAILTVALFTVTSLLLGAVWAWVRH